MVWVKSRCFHDQFVTVIFRFHIIDANAAAVGFDKFYRGNQEGHDERKHLSCV